jgi:photosystem II stability/assembly factor-like uncharacterized protein
MEETMKIKTGAYAVVVALILAALACVPPWGSEPSPEPPENIPTDTEVPTEDPVIITEAPTEEVPTEEPAATLPIYTEGQLFDIEMFTPTEGWAITRYGNRLLITQDGGETWLDATPPEFVPPPAGSTELNLRPTFLNASTVWFTDNLSGTANLYKTEDGGITWEIIPLPFDNARYELLDSETGFAIVSLGAGAGSHYLAIHRTDDGGATWTEVFSHEPGESKSLREGGSKSGFTFLDVNHGWVGGAIPMEDYVYLFYTTDGGATWTEETGIEIDVMFQGHMMEVMPPVFVSDTIGFLPIRSMAPEGFINFLIYKTEDAGSTWTYQNFTDDCRDFTFFSPDEAWCAAQFNLIHTLDGGGGWFVPSSSGIPSDEFYLKVDFVDSQHGWTITTPDDSTWEPTKLYRTADGGATWTLLSP